MFRQALQLFQDSDTRAYGAREPSTNLNRLIENTQQFIEIQEALIRRGR
jgi:hypothetical protein